tara:strand:+ start:251 stop:1195 length:945 start_codon:yes stop_codon:yes gene_type:complete
MQETYNSNHSNDFDDQIDLQKVFHVLFHEKWIIVSVTGLMSIIGIIYSLLLPNIYESKAILVPVNSSSSISRSIRNYSGLAGLAGINIPSAEDAGNSTKAIKKISSLSFFENNILTNINLPDLMAIKSWNSEANTLVYDESIYNLDDNTWVREYSYPRKQIPSAQESFEVFKSKHLILNVDEMTGFITLSIKHQSPFVAKEWAALIVDEVNTYYRQKDKAESETASSYLNEQISMTSLSEIKQVLAQLLQEETKKLTLIEANTSYVFDYIDPPAVMEKKSDPKRSIICILSGIMGVILGITLALVRNYIFSKRT